MLRVFAPFVDVGRVFWASSGFVGRLCLQSDADSISQEEDAGASAPPGAVPTKVV